MSETFPRVRVAAIQAASVFLDRDASVAKACDLIREAGRNGARLIAFPEGFIPAHPTWYHFHPATSAKARSLSVELFKNSVEIPGPEIAEVAEAARDASAYVVMGVCERRRNTTGTMYNTQVFVGRDGTILGKRQKLVPTVGERLVHAPGTGDILTSFDTDFGPTSALMCAENSNPLAVFAMTAQYSRVHVMSWPSHFAPSQKSMKDRVLVNSRAFALSSKAFVVSVCGAVDKDMIEKMGLTGEDAAIMRSDDFSGGSVIVDPTTEVVAGPLGKEEAILYADLDLEATVSAKLEHDFAGHYNRPDVFHLSITPGNRGIQSKPITVSAGREPDLEPFYGDAAGLPAGRMAGAFPVDEVHELEPPSRA